jgi:hypothetical protein
MNWAMQQIARKAHDGTHAGTTLGALVSFTAVIANLLSSQISSAPGTAVRSAP